MEKRAWEPWLRRVHSGYFMVVLSLILVHSLLALDGFLPGRHSAPIFHYVLPYLTLLTVAHLATAIGLVLALYLPEHWWWIGRVCCVLSILIFNTQAFFALYAFAVNDAVSLVQFSVYVTLSMSGAATAREPLTRHVAVLA